MHERAEQMHRQHTGGRTWIATESVNGRSLAGERGHSTQQINQAKGIGYKSSQEKLCQEQEFQKLFTVRDLGTCSSLPVHEV